MAATATKARKRKPKRPLESAVQKACIAKLELHGWRVERRNTGAMRWRDTKGKSRIFKFGTPGASDLFGWVLGRGRHFECEAKRQGERPTLEQVAYLLHADATGAIAFWVDSAERCEEVVRHVNNGGLIRYLDTKRTYPVIVKKKKVGEVEGPSGDYELV